MGRVVQGSSACGLIEWQVFSNCLIVPLVAQRCKAIIKINLLAIKDFIASDRPKAALRVSRPDV